MMASAVVAKSLRVNIVASRLSLETLYADGEYPALTAAEPQQAAGRPKAYFFAGAHSAS
jgi:hypothetical protein